MGWHPAEERSIDSAVIEVKRDGRMAAEAGESATAEEPRATEMIVINALSLWS